MKQEENIVETIMRGSANIDELQRKIHDTVQLVCSYVDATEYGGHTSLSYGPNQDGISWNIYFGDPRPHHVTCTDGAWDNVIYRNVGKNRFTKLDRVRSAYEALPLFIEFLMQRSKLRNRLQFVFDEAET